MESEEPYQPQILYIPKLRFSLVLSAIPRWTGATNRLLCFAYIFLCADGSLNKWTLDLMWNDNNFNALAAIRCSEFAENDHAFRIFVKMKMKTLFLFLRLLNLHELLIVWAFFTIRKFVIVFIVRSVNDAIRLYDA